MLEGSRAWECLQEIQKQERTADPAVAYAAAGIADKMSAVRAIMAVCGCGCMAGRTAAGSGGLCYGKAGLF